MGRFQSWKGGTGTGTEKDAGVHALGALVGWGRRVKRFGAFLELGAGSVVRTAAVCDVAGPCLGVGALCLTRI